MTNYCVIGAGAAGISALQQLRHAGYDALHLITSKT